MRIKIARARQFYLILLSLIGALASALFVSPAALASDPDGNHAVKAIVVHGDSLSAGYGIDPAEGWVALLDARINQEFPGQFALINSSVSGETTTGGLARLPQLLETIKPALVVIELGGNDGLQGQPLDLIAGNLTQMLTLVNHSGAQSVLIGIQIPPNYGPRYARGFSAIFMQVADAFDATNPAKKIARVPFLLDKVATDVTLMQRDGIHPTAAAQAQLLENVWPALKPILTQLAADSPRAITPGVDKNSAIPH